MQEAWRTYCCDIVKAFETLEWEAELIPYMVERVRGGHKVFVAGNGGSAAIAMHCVSDLSRPPDPTTRRTIEAEWLNANVSTLTAIANDRGYEYTMLLQILGRCKANDLLILISSSGNSENIVRAAEFARSEGVAVIGITGCDGGRLRQLADFSVHVASNSYAICESVHGAFCHFLTNSLVAGLGT